MQPLPPDWISTGELEAQLQFAEGPITSRQLERWRSEGLLPQVVQVGNGSGSTVWHHPVTARQAIAIERALAFKNRINFAGEILWVAGFEVGDRHWRPQLEKSHTTAVRFLTLAPRFAAADDDRDTFGDRVLAEKLTGEISKLSRRLGSVQMARFINVGLEIAQGDYEPETLALSDRDGATTLGIALDGLDLGAGDNDRVMGQGFNFRKGLGEVLSLMSDAASRDAGSPFDDSEIGAARDDVRNAFKIAVCLYEATTWIYGPRAFGLRLASSLGKAASPALFRTYTLAFARLRRESGDLLSSSEIARLAIQAENVWLISTWLRDVQNRRPDLRKIIGPKALKITLTDSLQHRNLLEELGRCGLPLPAFRPWDQWARLSKKTTIRSGLLAMSIGSATRLKVSAILRSESADVNL